MQGRVTAADINSPAAAQGWTCNLNVVSHFATPGGYRVWRYTDQAGHVCAFYDTSLFSPLNAVGLQAGPSPGVVVLNMADPTHPVQTALLTSLPMLSPHESLNLNVKRGLLAADLGNGGAYPGLMSIYSVAQDCLHPVLDSTSLPARFGHESGFSPDGNTFWITGGEGIAAVDVSDPKHPKTLWQGNVFAHGLNLSDDGDTLYDSNPIDGNLTLLDVSQIQNRVPRPVVTEKSAMTWNTVSIPQNTDPMTIDGKPYLLEFDEFAFRLNPPAANDQVGGARIISIADPLHPRVVSNLRLAVNMPAEHKAADSDPSALASPTMTYASHYCQIPREIDPEIAACSFINSGLRIFNIQNPLHPYEVAYFVAPPKASTLAGAMPADLAMSQPAFDPARHEVWYSDATSGFYNVKLDKNVWPDPLGVPNPTTCVSPSGSIAHLRLGALALGEKRSSARSVFNKYSTRGRRYFDFYCLSGGGLRAGYASAKLLRSLPASHRAGLAGRIVLALTSDRFYSYRGIGPGSSLALARRRLDFSRGWVVGLNTWYLIEGGSANGVVKVRHGQIQEVGIANRALTSTGAEARAFFQSFGHSVANARDPLVNARAKTASLGTTYGIPIMPGR